VWRARSVCRIVSADDLRHPYSGVEILWAHFPGVPLCVTPGYTPSRLRRFQRPTPVLDARLQPSRAHEKDITPPIPPRRSGRPDFRRRSSLQTRK
jgi:hypothetical protein